MCVVDMSRWENVRLIKIKVHLSGRKEVLPCSLLRATAGLQNLALGEGEWRLLESLGCLAINSHKDLILGE